MWSLLLRLLLGAGADGQRAVLYPEAQALISELESSYCAVQQDFTPCNEQAGKVCVGGSCLSFCNAGYSACRCTSAPNACSVCCRTADGACVASHLLGLLDAYSQPWVRQSQAERCSKASGGSGSGPLCALIENGKVCDLSLKPVSAVESPHICVRGRCNTPRCALVGGPGVSLNDCGCRDEYSKYPFCCQQVGNFTCLPYQWWMRQYPQNYLNSIVTEGGLPFNRPQPADPSFGDTTARDGAAVGPGTGTVQFWNPCNRLNSEGTRCGPKQVCRGFRCVHTCGDNGVGECVCPPGSRDECHLCCVQNGLCLSSGQLRDLPAAYFRPQGTPCNFTFGTCSNLGQCSKLDFHPSANYCRERNLQECLCLPGTNAECQVCCMQGGQCRAMAAAAGTLGRPPTRPVGTPCNFTFGVCSVDGTCTGLSRHPSDSLCKRPENTGKQCRERSVCQEAVCSHICGRAELECECTAGGLSECHICCLGSDQSTCSSMYSKRPEAFLLRPVGSSCNFTFGTCTSQGICKKVAGVHPGDSFCQRQANVGRSCDEKRVCRDGACQHVCAETSRLCRCPAGSPSECHVCCVNGLGQCNSIFDGRSQDLTMEIGSPCNFTFGSCDAQGSCEAVRSHPAQEFCAHASNAGSQCGELRECRDGACRHVCRATGRLCKCPPASSQECHICCLGENGQCSSVYDGANPFLLQPVGNPCNYTFGTCDSAGSCRPIRRHPATAFCELAENNGASCGVERTCQGFECRHLCGSPSQLCVCPAESSVECQLCCIGADAQCRSVYDGISSFRLRPPGSACNFTFGLCDSAGHCAAVRRHPGFGRCQVEGSDGAECGVARHCFKGECRHICGSQDKACRCPPGLLGECHQCCVKDGVCTSLYDNQTPLLLQPLGSPCNYTYGVCDATGRCQPLKDHPGMQTCQFFENAGKQCGPHHKCKDFQCQHVCGSASLECRCEAGSPDECHVCCIKNGECRSAYDERNQFLLQSVGSSCNLTLGTCTGEGRCELRATYCMRAVNAERQCGPKHICGTGACRHVCGIEEDECVCDPSGSDECHVCCLSSETEGGNRTCASALNEARAFLTRPVGSACNFTRGVCVRGGACDDVVNHPFYSDKDAASAVLSVAFFICTPLYLLYRR